MSTAEQLCVDAIDPLELVTAHEASHAIAAISFGHTVELVSIRPADHWRGFCLHRAAEVEGAAARVSGQPVSGSPRHWPPRGVPIALTPYDIRADVESSILVCYAGPAGEELWPQLQRYRGHWRISDEADREDAQRELEEFAPTTAQHEELLVKHEEKGAQPTDGERAWELSTLLVAEEEAALYLQWLQAAARRLVRTDNFIRCLQALVPPLLEQEQLAGEAVVEILNSTNLTPQN